jgi:transcriptional regulator with XRE-family HTH domain
MPNDRLRDVLLRHGLTPDQVAERLDVDRKTVERWITMGRTPYPRHRHAIAAMVGEGEAYLWPDALPADRRTEVAESEIVQVYPHRAAVPADLWPRMLKGAAERLDILVYAGLFLPEQNARLLTLLREQAEAGTKVRMLLGDPESAAVAERGAEEGIGDAMAGKIRNVLVLYRPIADVPGIKVRLHATTLYNSLYRFDEEMFVNTHIYGVPASHAPVLHLRKLSAGDLFDTYTDSFERVWAGSHPAWADQAQ